MPHMLTTYLKQRLKEMGYLDIDLGYSLSYSQGDGVAWYGMLHDESLLTLASRLLKGKEKAAITRICNKGEGVAVIRNVGYGRYHHWNTMRVENHEGASEILTPFEEQVWNSFLETIGEDVKGLSCVLEHEGYSLIEACSPRWWWKGEERKVDKPVWGIELRSEMTSEGRLVAYLIEDDPSYEFLDATESHDYSLLKQMVKGDLCACSIEIHLDGECVESLSLLDDPSGDHVLQLANETFQEVLKRIKGGEQE